MRLEKYSGAGNNFIIINNLDGSITDFKDFVIDIISKKENQDIDGIIFLENSPVADFRMNYFNKDGSGNALCANGLRCTVKYINNEKISLSENIYIEAVGKIYHCRVIDSENISTQLPPPELIKLNFRLRVQFTEWWQDIIVSYVEVGSPHIVIFIDDIEKPTVRSLDEIDIINWGRNVRMHRDLMPEGANVNFIQIRFNGNQLSIRSYERGVEGETLACGTGALSSAIVASELRKINTPVKILTRSGNYLTVDIIKTGDEIKHLVLTGPAKKY